MTRRYSLLTFLVWLPTGLYITPMVLLLLERGLDLTAVAAVGAVYGVTVMVLELPTGGLADVLGRRPVMVASAVASLLGLAFLGLAETLWLLVVSSMLRGVARALSSGPLEAWFVDAVHPDEVARGLAHGAVWSSVALALGTVAGGLIPTVWGTSLAVPILIGAAFEVVRLLITLFGMPESRPHPSTLGSIFRGIPRTIAIGLKLGMRNRILIRVMGSAAAAGTSLAVVELLTPAWMATLAGTTAAGALAYGIVAAIGFSADGVGSSLSLKVLRWTGSASRAVAVGLTISVVALGCLAGAATLHGTGGLIAAGAAYLLMFLGLGICIAPQGQLLHAQVATSERATVVSVQSLLLQVGGAIGAIALGKLASATSPAVSFVVAALVLAVPAALFSVLETRSNVITT